jgi:hypothetical protein
MGINGYSIATYQVGCPCADDDHIFVVHVLSASHVARLGTCETQVCTMEGGSQDKGAKTGKI